MLPSKPMTQKTIPSKKLEKNVIKNIWNKINISKKELMSNSIWKKIKSNDDEWNWNKI